MPCPMLPARAGVTPTAAHTGETTRADLTHSGSSPCMRGERARHGVARLGPAWLGSPPHMWGANWPWGTLAARPVVPAMPAVRRPGARPDGTGPGLLDILPGQ